jgi:hypothetical protein
MFAERFLPGRASVWRGEMVNYIRIQARYRGKTGKPGGIFGACHHLRRRVADAIPMHIGILSPITTLFM